MMADKDVLQGKRILIVDNEPDVLHTFEAMLTISEVSKAFSFDETKGLLATQCFDIAVLDIKGGMSY